MKNLVFFLSIACLIPLISMEKPAAELSLFTRVTKTLGSYRQQNPQAKIETPAVVNALAVTTFENRSFVAAALNDSRVALYDLASKACAGIFDDHTQRVRTIGAFEHEKALCVFSGGNDKRLCIRNLTWDSAKKVFIDKSSKKSKNVEHQETITVVTHAVSRRLKNILSASLDGTVRAWSLDGTLLAATGTNKDLDADHAPRPPIYSLVTIPEKDSFKMVSGGINTITVWDDACRKVTEFDLCKLNIPAGIINALVYSSESGSCNIFAGSSGKLFLSLNIDTRNCNYIDTGFSIESLGTSKTLLGNYILVGDLFGGSIRKLSGGVLVNLGNKRETFRSILGLQNTEQIITAQLNNIGVWDVLEIVKKFDTLTPPQKQKIEAILSQEIPLDQRQKAWQEIMEIVMEIVKEA